MTAKEKLRQKIVEIEKEHDNAMAHAKFLRGDGGLDGRAPVNLLHAAIDKLKHLTAKHATMMAEYRQMEG